ncbi:hypothetical protein QQ054_16875 [Oscillatoria amoena NRMC-F 0135]|nr:hypothetical protein [Oscillatoria amoena NRMC-F 0135]
MYYIIWQYRVKPEYLTEFISYYRAEGEWAKLFRLTVDYAGTDLLTAPGETGTFLTVDRWQSENSYNEFLKKNKERYEELDNLCSRFTTEEKLIGRYFDIG